MWTRVIDRRDRKQMKKNQQCVKLEKDMHFIRIIVGYLFGDK